MKSGRPPYSACLIRVVGRCRARVRPVGSIRSDNVRLAGKLTGSNRETVFFQWCWELLSGHRPYGVIDITPEIDGDLSCALASLLLLYRSTTSFRNQSVVLDQRRITGAGKEFSALGRLVPTA